MAYSQLHEFDDKLHIGAPYKAEFTDISNRSTCALFCQRYGNDCQGFFYNKGTQECKLTATVYWVLGTNEVDAPGFVYYAESSKKFRKNI